LNKAARFLAAGAALLALGAASCATAAPKAAAKAPPPEPGVITVLDAKTKGDWTPLGQSTWRFADGVYVADGLAPGAPAPALLSKGSYKNFVLHAEFWVSEDANSGIFIRCSDPTKLTDRNCYEVNIYDKRADPTYGTGGVVHFAEVQGTPAPKAGGQWNTMEITADGRNVTVTLNGAKTAEFKSDYLLEGPIALQLGVGTVKFRKVTIKPL
jgi:hypothetical protein